MEQHNEHNHEQGSHDHNNQSDHGSSAPTPPSVPSHDGGSSNSGQQSIDQNKILGIIGYIIPLLFFLPLITDAKNDKFAKYHANQQLLLLLFWVIGQIAASVLTIVIIGVLLYPIVMIAGIVFMIMGIINVANGQMKPLPIIGKWELIK